MSIVRSAGILLPVSALPSPYGIGTFGKAAFDFVDFLDKTGVSYWQVLPLGPTGYGDSPYQSFSAFAGSPYYVDLDLLAEEGLLTPEELSAFDWGGNARYVDYEKQYFGRFGLLRKAGERAAACQKLREAVGAFTRENAWLPDYALFMAAKDHFDSVAWVRWPDEELRLHHPEAVARYRALLADDIFFYEFIQYEFFEQWKRVRDYAHERGIRIIGDIPLYVAMDSADAWSEPEFFQMDERNIPVEVAGVPPDYFSENGQLWGNPLYNYERMRADGYGWWIRRVGGAEKLYDVLRIDHFRGFSTYWAVPNGSETAKTGRWVVGPGMDLVGTLTSWFHRMDFIAEDLGDLSADVYALLKASGLPGMKVLQFAFDGLEENEYQPHLYNENCICYVGTHDNATTAEWEAEARPEVLSYVREYLGDSREALTTALIRAGYRSTAKLFVSTVQDWLGLGAEARINTPGTLGMNWQWRLLPGEADEALAERIFRFNVLYSRLKEEAKEKLNAEKKAAEAAKAAEAEAAEPASPRVSETEEKK